MAWTKWVLSGSASSCERGGLRAAVIMGFHLERIESGQENQADIFVLEGYVFLAAIFPFFHFSMCSINPINEVRQLNVEL
jgi:hypothetical protein